MSDTLNLTLAAMVFAAALTTAAIAIPVAVHAQEDADDPSAPRLFTPLSPEDRPSIIDTDRVRERADQMRTRVFNQVEESRGDRTDADVVRPIDRIRTQQLRDDADGDDTSVVNNGRDDLRARAFLHRDEAIERAKNRREEALERIQERRLEIRAQVSERVYTGVTHMLERLMSHVEKLSSILDRVVERLDMLADRGYDTSVARASIAEAEAAIAEAADEISSVQATVEQALNSEIPREELSDIRTSVRGAIEKMRAAHRAVASAISSIRTVVGNNDFEDSDSDDGSDNTDDTDE